MAIKKGTAIKLLVELPPGAVRYFMKEKIRCIVCGLPHTGWGSKRKRVNR